MSGRPGGWLANNGRQENEQGGFLRRRGGHATGTKRTSQGEKRYLADGQGGVDEGRKLCLAQGPGNLRRDLRWYAKYGTDAYRRTVQNGDAESGRSRMLP